MSRPVSQMAGIDWDRERRLGVMPDTALARALGVSHTAVFSARRTRGIPRAPCVRPPTRLETDPRLGVVADAVLAEEYGASYSMVHRARERLGLPSPMPSGVCPGREMRKVVLACSLGDHIVPSELGEAVGWSTEAVLRARPWVADLVDDVGGAWVRR